MKEQPDALSIADLLGPWVEPDWDSGLVARSRGAWGIPLSQLTNEELATLLRQGIAPEHVLIVAEARLRDGVDDNTEMYEGELREAVKNAKNNL